MKWEPMKNFLVGVGGAILFAIIIIPLGILLTRYACWVAKLILPPL